MSNWYTVNKSKHEMYFMDTKHHEALNVAGAVAKRYFVPPPTDCNLPPLSGAGSLRSPKICPSRYHFI